MLKKSSAVKSISIKREFVLTLKYFCFLMICIPYNLPNDLIETLSFHLNEIHGLISVSFCLERERGMSLDIVEPTSDLITYHRHTVLQILKLVTVIGNIATESPIIVISKLVCNREHHYKIMRLMYSLYSDIDFYQMSLSPSESTIFHESITSYLNISI